MIRTLAAAAHSPDIAHDDVPTPCRAKAEGSRLDSAAWRKYCSFAPTSSSRITGFHRFQQAFGWTSLPCETCGSLVLFGSFFKDCDELTVLRLLAGSTKSFPLDPTLQPVCPAHSNPHSRTMRMPHQCFLFKSVEALSPGRGIRNRNRLVSCHCRCKLQETLWMSCKAEFERCER